MHLATVCTSLVLPQFNGKHFSWRLLLPSAIVMLRLPLLVSAVFSVLVYVHAQSNDSVKFFIPSKVRTADFATCSYSWQGEVTHNPKNVSFELMVGKAEDNGNEVADIIEINSVYPQLTSFGWQVRAATPPGDYHIRMNATIYDSLKGRVGAIAGDTIGPFTQRSETFPIALNKPFECTVPGWEPVRSIFDPTYAPLRVDLPNGGDVFYLPNATHTLATIGTSFSTVDVNYDRRDTTMTLELVNTRTSTSAGVQKLVSSDLVSSFQSLDLANFKIEAGPWKVRANYSAPGTANFVTFSEEFYISSQAPCGGLAAGNSSTAGGSGGGSPGGAPTSIAFSAFLLSVVPAIAISSMML
ncbi:hypothetical protein C8J57DRAFT_1468400 [Mycena rebaudengoi]|nr:hypothetical protein C8J57DRAFT_1468400 [Mycena rebaudengoi]